MLVLTALLAALTVVVTGCSSDTPQQNRSVVYIESLNDNTAPLDSDIITLGTIFPDEISVIFRNRPYSGLIITDPDSPYGYFEFTRYTVEWFYPDGTQAMATYESGMGLSVPTGKSSWAEVIIVTWENKVNPPVSTIPANTSLELNARITFYGHEVGTDRETAVVATLGVIFADFADPAAGP